MIADKTTPCPATNGIEPLAAAGVPIWIDEVIDEAVTLMGSYNWTRGAAANSENLNLVAPPTVTAAYAAHVRRRVSGAALRGNKVRPRTAALDTESHSYLALRRWDLASFALIKTRLSHRGLRLSNAKLLMLAPAVPAVGRSAGGVVEYLSRHRNLGHLERNVTPVANHLGADLNQLLAQAGQRPRLRRLGQRQRPHEISKVVGENVELEADSIGGEGTA